MGHHNVGDDRLYLGSTMSSRSGRGCASVNLAGHGDGSVSMLVLHNKELNIGMSATFITFVYVHVDKCECKIFHTQNLRNE